MMHISRLLSWFCGSRLSLWLAPILLIIGLFTLNNALAKEFFLPAPTDVDDAPLVIYSATDYQHLHPLLSAFQRRHPSVSIRFVDLNSSALYKRFLAEAPHSPADLLLSSAMDLQLKLVNDGYAQPHHSELSLSLPSQSHWRHQLFAFTLEPIVTVFNTQLLGSHPLPHSRQQLLSLLRSDPTRFADNIITYDIAASGVGYLLASQDSQQGLMYGRLLEAFGNLGVQLDDSSNDMLDRLAKGEVAVGYNILGSYVTAALARYPHLSAMAPDDYTLMLMRLALIPNTAPQPTIAGHLLDFILSEQGQALLTNGGLQPLLETELTSHLAPDLKLELKSNLQPELKPELKQRLKQESGELKLAIQAQGPVTLIPLTTALLPPLDPMVKQSFINTWASSINSALTTGP